MIILSKLLAIKPCRVRRYALPHAITREQRAAVAAPHLSARDLLHSCTDGPDFDLVNHLDRIGAVPAIIPLGIPLPDERHLPARGPAAANDAVMARRRA